ncbi:NAD(P)-dependent oxidoreductase [Actinoallomurus bryophytorum]|uniref:Nucleoside-diphosphate-sugar epimerase n=1 Tax=Actinoallomurus bryophytorum TaxID=1490222 RepID=A0A543CTA0_9ACTN|nr:NAD(P)-dependent oxidoreductase [Actinoallomurus bryophytorum]TQM00336.1 nucleoside-diphosphate-sugar epimerase [Actinoallomurus bryophytorum]
MHVFIAGGTGVLGRRIIPRLIAGGHRVTALTRTTDGGASVLAAGAVPALVDVYDVDALTRAVRLAAPDVVMHQLTALSGRDFAANARIRTVGTRNLVDAALNAGVGRVIAQSIAWNYEPGDKPADESVPLDLNASEPRRRGVESVNILETVTREIPEWVVLRYGLLYGTGTWYAPGGLMAGEAKAGRLVADHDVSSFVHVGDAAEAAVRALDWPSGTVNVCDDEPAPGTEWLPAFCHAVGAPPPERAAAELGRQGWARGADNGHARGDLHWTPETPSWRVGFAAFTG